jgi:hypothetical protein
VRESQELALPPNSAREMALLRIRKEGILILDDEEIVLELTGMLCRRLWDLPAEKVVPVAVKDDTASPKGLVATLKTIMQGRLENTGHGFAAVVSDYNLSYAGESTTIWSQVAAELTPTCREKCWNPMGRVLISGYITPELESEILNSGLFDAVLRKPFNRQQLEDSVLDAIAKRSRDGLA